MSYCWNLIYIPVNNLFAKVGCSQWYVSWMSPGRRLTGIIPTTPLTNLYIHFHWIEQCWHKESNVSLFTFYERVSLYYDIYILNLREHQFLHKCLIFHVNKLISPANKRESQLLMIFKYLHVSTTATQHQYQITSCNNYFACFMDTEVLCCSPV